MLRGYQSQSMCRRHFYIFKERAFRCPGNVPTNCRVCRVCRDRGRVVGVQVDRTIDVPGIPSGEGRRSQVLQQPRAHRSGVRSSLDKYRTCPERNLGPAGQCQHRSFLWCHLESAGECHHRLFLQCHLESTGKCRHQMFDIPRHFGQCCFHEV